MKQSTEITEGDIKELSDETPIDEEYLRDSVQSQRADNKYEESVLDADYQNKNMNTVNKIKNALRFVSRSFFPNPTIPNYGKVIDVRSPKDIDTIIIETKTEYAEIPSEYEDYDRYAFKEFEFNLKSTESKEKLDRLVHTLNVSRPSDLEGKRIPTVFINEYDDKSPMIGRRQKYRFYPFNYKIDVIHSNMTNSEKVGRYIRRMLMKLKCFERSKDTGEKQGKYCFNRNVLVYLNLVLGIPAILSSNPLLMCFGFFFMGLYLTCVIASISAGIYEVFTKNEGERDRIETKINK